MLSDDHERQPSLDSFRYAPIDLKNVRPRKDEYSEIIANMTKTLHVNTPEHTITLNDIDFDDFDDNGNNGNTENKLSNKPQLIEQLQAQLIHNQRRRTQPRDYARILRDSNTPVSWYKAPSKNRSVYFYDSNYQKYVQQQSASPQKIKPDIRSILPQSLRIQERLRNHSSFGQYNSFPFTPRTKYVIDLYNTAVNYHQQKQRSNQNYPTTSSTISQQYTSTPSRLRSIPTLPPI